MSAITYSRVYPAADWTCPGRPTLPGATPPQGGNRDSLVYGTYQPDATTTGLWRPTTSTVTSSNNIIVLSTAGATYNRVLFMGRVVISAPNITLNECEVRWPTAYVPTQGVSMISASTAMTTAGNSLGGLVIKDSLIDGLGFSWWVNGIAGGNYRIERSEVRGVVDGISFSSIRGDRTVLANWLHGGKHFTWTPPGGDGQSDGQTHNDAIQFHGGSNNIIRYNTLGGDRYEDDYNNAGIMLSQVRSEPEAVIGDTWIDHNWFGGGAAGLHMITSATNKMATVHATDNVFFRKPQGFYIHRRADFAGEIARNTFDDGTPVTITTA